MSSWYMRSVTAALYLWVLQSQPASTQIVSIIVVSVLSWQRKEVGSTCYLNAAWRITLFSDMQQKSTNSGFHYRSVPGFQSSQLFCNLYGDQIMCVHSPLTAWVNSLKGLNEAEGCWPQAGAEQWYIMQSVRQVVEWVSRIGRCIDPFIHSFYTLSFSACGNTAVLYSNTLFASLDIKCVFTLFDMFRKIDQKVHLYG